MRIHHRKDEEHNDNLKVMEYACHPNINIWGENTYI